MAVAIKKHGFNEIKIYNGGLKDWIKSGNDVVIIDDLPEYEGSFIDAEGLMDLLTKSENCLNADNRPAATILDYRTEAASGVSDSTLFIRSKCPSIKMLLDDFADPEARAQIPKQGLVVLISETGNRDAFAMQYLNSHGYDNVKGLRFGMRAWIKAGHPVECAGDALWENNETPDQQ